MEETGRNKTKMALDFFAGCLGGCAGTLVGHPFDTIKVHLQTQDHRNPKYKGNWDCLRKIVATESITGLYRGMSSPIIGVSLINAVIFGVYGETQRHIPDPNSLTSCFISGAIAGFAQSPICSLIELAKTRMQLSSSTGRPFRGPFQFFIYTYRHEGLRGLFRGLGCTFMREIPSFGLYFLTYETLMRNLDNKPVPTFYILLAGGLAGTCSWVTTYPIDVIKSRIQANGNRYAGIYDCLRQSVRKEGYAFLYKGISSTVLRAFPMNAVTFTVVNWTFKLLGEDEKKKSKTTESIGEISEPCEILLEKWNNFLTSASRSMVIHRLPYSTLSLTSMNEPKLEWGVRNRRMKEGGKSGEWGDRGNREEENENLKMFREVRREEKKLKI